MSTIILFVYHRRKWRRTHNSRSLQMAATVVARIALSYWVVQTDRHQSQWSLHANAQHVMICPPHTHLLHEFFFSFKSLLHVCPLEGNERERERESTKLQNPREISSSALWAYNAHICMPKHTRTIIFPHVKSFRTLTRRKSQRPHNRLYFLYTGSTRWTKIVITLFF